MYYECQVRAPVLPGAVEYNGSMTALFPLYAHRCFTHLIASIAHRITIFVHDLFICYIHRSSSKKIVHPAPTHLVPLHVRKTLNECVPLAQYCTRYTGFRIRCILDAVCCAVRGLRRLHNRSQPLRASAAEELCSPVAARHHWYRTPRLAHAPRTAAAQPARAVSHP